MTSNAEGAILQALVMMVVLKPPEKKHEQHGIFSSPSHSGGEHQVEIAYGVLQ